MRKRSLFKIGVGWYRLAVVARTSISSGLTYQDVENIKMDRYSLLIDPFNRAWTEKRHPSIKIGILLDYYD